MDSQAQLQRTHGQHQAEEPIRIHHLEEEGPAKVLKKMKEKANKIKKALTKHGHGHEHDRGEHIPDDHDLDEEDDEDDYEDQELHGGAPAGGEIGAAPTIAALGRKQKTGEHDQLGLGRDLPEKSHGFDLKSGPKMGKQLPAANYGSGLGKEFPARSHEFDVKSGADLRKDSPTGTQGIRNLEYFDLKAQERGDAMHQPNQSSASVTSVVADKAAAPKNAVASKLGYSGEGGDGGHENFVEGEQTPSSGSGYGNKVAGMVTPVYEKVKETGASVMTKLPFSGGGTGTETETQQGQDKGVSAREYLKEKLSPGEEDKALSEVVAEKLHLGGGGGCENTAKKGAVTQSEEVEKRLGGFSGPRSEGEMKHGEAFAEEGEGGMVEKLREAVTSWVSGTTEEVMQKSTESVQDSSQSVDATVGNMGFSGSGADGAGQRSGGN